MKFIKSLLGTDANTLSAADAKQRLEGVAPLYILDVRQPEEFRNGHIAGATSIPLGELSARLKELPKDQEILCVCASGSRSSAATQLLTNEGYKAINLRGGMTGWQFSGFAVKTGN